MVTRLRPTERRLPYVITHRTQVNVPHLIPSQAGQYTIYLPGRDS